MFWLSACALAVASVAATIVLLPNRNTPRETFSDQPAQVAGRGNARLSAAEHRRINETVDRFVLAALDRSDPATAWALAGPDLRGTSTVADWATGTMPIPVYRARGTRFHGWTQVAVARDSVSFDLIVQPRAGSKDGPLALSVQVIRRANEWVVNRLYPVASFTPVGQQAHVVGPNDFAAAGRGEPAATRGTLRGKWIAAPAALFALGLLAVVLILSRNWLRFRRVRRAFATSSNSAMPSLPRNLRRPGADLPPD